MSEPLTKDQARENLLCGWNIRCNNCGSYGARWITGQRPGWGSLALCPEHQKELELELERHKKKMKEIRAINYEQSQ